MLNSNARPNNAHRNSELDSRNNYTTSEELSSSKISTTLFSIYIPRQLSEFHMHARLATFHKLYVRKYVYVGFEYFPLHYSIDHR